MEKKICNFTWHTGDKRRVQHKCPLEAGHGGRHKCNTPCLATKGDDTPVPLPEIEDDTPSPSDTHVQDPNGARSFGVVLALCGERQQTILGTVRGCKFAPAPEAATCPKCKKMAASTTNTNPGVDNGQ